MDVRGPMPRCTIHGDRQPMQLSVPGPQDVRGWGWSTLSHVADAVGEVAGRTMDGRVVSRIGNERPGLR